jgi:solute carrier family 25 (mitochondrial carnitine/acylcarnitine transporter), member 20/29
MSAIPSTIVTAPVERAKVLLQVCGPCVLQQPFSLMVIKKVDTEKKYKGVFDVVKQLYREGGIRSIYRGSFATVARDGPGSAA